MGFENAKIKLNEKVIMCSGVCCDIRENCWRHKLNKVFSTGNVRKHKNPRFLEPAYNGKDCPFYIETRMS